MFSFHRFFPGPAARCIRVALIALLLHGGSSVLADEESPFRFQGFGTLGAAKTTTSDVEFVRDLSQARGADDHWTPNIDSVLGIQATWRVNARLEAVVQGMARYGYRGDFSPEIAWAFVKYDPVPNLSLRAGRLGTEFFMMADSRWVGYSFLTVRPPGDYFWYLPFYTIYGGDAAITIPLGEGVVRTKAFYGLSNGRIPLAEEQWDINGSPMIGAYVEYQLGAWQIRGSYANIRFKNDLPVARVLKQSLNYDLTAAQSDFLAARNTRSHYYSLGVVFDQGPWQAQLMLNHIKQGSNVFESSDGGYALIGYRIGKVTPYLGYSWIYSREKTRLVTGNPFEDFITNYVMEDAHAEQQTTFAGVRWDVVRNVALKAQWDSIRGVSKSYFPYRQDKRSTWDGSTNVFSLTMDFVF